MDIDSSESNNEEDKEDNLDISKGDFSINHSTNLFNRLTSLEINPTIPFEFPSIEHRVNNKKGRPKGKTNLTFTDQLLLGISSNIDGSTKAAREFNVSIPTADGYKDGSTQQARKDPLPKKELKSALDETLKKAKEKAANCTLKAIESISDETIEGLGKNKPLLASQLAVQMSTIVEKLTPKEREGSDNRVQIVVYGPEERTEDKYERLDVALNLEDR